MKITALMSVWNSSLWLPYSLRGIYPYFDTIVISECCWVPGEWSGATSPDGTAEIIKNFMSKEDPEHKVRFHQAGMVRNQPEGRNSGLYLVPEDTSYIYMVDSDEFYMPDDLCLLRKAIERPEFKNYATIATSAKCFYYDFTYVRRERFMRGWKWFPSQHFWAVANMVDAGGKTFYPEKLGIEIFHYSYVCDSPNRLKIKACIGEDVTREKYNNWYTNTFSKFDGTNLEKLCENNGGGIHVSEGGTLDRYYGPHPPVLEDHPLRYREWGKYNNRVDA